MLSTLFVVNVKRLSTRQVQIFDNIIGYEGIKRTFIRSLNSKEPVHSKDILKMFNCVCDIPKKVSLLSNGMSFFSAYLRI
jgi:hypothetical protein